MLLILFQLTHSSQTIEIKKMKLKYFRRTWLTFFTALGLLENSGEVLKFYNYLYSSWVRLSYTFRFIFLLFFPLLFTTEKVSGCKLLNRNKHDNRLSLLIYDQYILSTYVPFFFFFKKKLLLHFLIYILFILFYLV